MTSVTELRVALTVPDFDKALAFYRDALGLTQITIQFDLSRNIDAALQDVQTKIAQAQRNLPREIDPPVVTPPLPWAGA